QVNLLGIDDDDVISNVEMMSERRLVLASQDRGDPAGHSPEHLISSIHQEPLSIHCIAVRLCGYHGLPTEHGRTPRKNRQRAIVKEKVKSVNQFLDVPFVFPVQGQSSSTGQSGQSGLRA